MIPYKFKYVNRKDIARFIEQYHYSHNVNGITSNYSFGVYEDDTLIGAAMIGLPAMPAQRTKYAITSPDKVTELRRLVLIDDTPRNTESWFIGNIIRWLKANTEIDVVISYADPNHNHVGTIYKASNFTYMGMSGKGRVICYRGKTYHDKVIRTKNNGVLKPFAQEIKAALLTGEAFYIPQKAKHIYRYIIKRKHNAKTRNGVK